MVGLLVLRIVHLRAKFSVCVVSSLIVCLPEMLIHHGNTQTRRRETIAS